MLKCHAERSRSISTSKTEAAIHFRFQNSNDEFEVFKNIPEVFVTILEIFKIVQ